MTDRQTDQRTNLPAKKWLLKVYENIKNGFIMCKTPFKQFCDKWTDRQMDQPTNRRTDQKVT